MKARVNWEKIATDISETVQEQKAEIALMRPVFRAALGVCVTGKSTVPQLIDACIKAARKSTVPQLIDACIKAARKAKGK